MIEGVRTEGGEFLYPEDYSRLNGDYHRIAAAEQQLAYDTGLLSERYGLGQRDGIGPDGRILRAGRDDQELADQAAASSGSTG